MDEKWRNDMSFFYPNVKVDHNSLPKYDFDKLQEYACTEFKNYPTYSFWYANTEPSNHIERAIGKMMGYPRKHMEYWTKVGEELNIVHWHVDGDEVSWRSYEVEEEGVRLDKKTQTQISSTSYILYLKLTDVQDGELMILPYSKYVEGRGLFDQNYDPLEGTPILKITPHENMCVKMENKIYHKTAPMLNGFKLILAWSEWDFVPEGFKKHKHWIMRGSHVVPTAWIPNEHNYREI